MGVPGLALGFWGRPLVWRAFSQSAAFGVDVLRKALVLRRVRGL